MTRSQFYAIVMALGILAVLSAFQGCSTGDLL